MSVSLAPKWTIVPLANSSNGDTWVLLGSLCSTMALNCAVATAILGINNNALVIPAVINEDGFSVANMLTLTKNNRYVRQLEGALVPVYLIACSSASSLVPWELQTP